jgi:hypothetical protein
VTSLAHKLSTLYPLFMNGKCENLPTWNAIFIPNILADFLAHNLSILYPLFIKVNVKMYQSKKQFSLRIFSRLFQLESYLPSYLSTVNVKGYRPQKTNFT